MTKFEFTGEDWLQRYVHHRCVEFVQYLKVDGENENSVWSWVRAINAVHVPMCHIGSVPIPFKTPTQAMELDHRSTDSEERG